MALLGYVRAAVLHLPPFITEVRVAKLRSPYDRAVLARLTQELDIELQSIFAGLLQAADPDEEALAIFAGMPPLVQQMHFRKAISKLGATFTPQAGEPEPEDAESLEQPQEERDEEE